MGCSRAADICLLRARIDFRHSPRPSRLISAIARAISAIRITIFAIRAGLDAATDHKRALQRLARHGCNCCKSNCLNCPSKGEVSHETGRCFSLGFAGNRLCPTRDPPFLTQNGVHSVIHGGETANSARPQSPCRRSAGHRGSPVRRCRRVSSRRASWPRSPRAGLRSQPPSPPSTSSRRSRPRA